MRRAVAGAVLVLVVTGACATVPDGSDPRGLAPDVAFVGSADRGARADTIAAASVELGALLVALAEGENAIVSPLSLQLALAVLREGASGEAAAALDAVLGLPGPDGSQAVADLRARLDRWAGDVTGIDPEEPPEEVLVHLADAVFVQPDFPVEASFLERAAAYHRAGVFEADFAARTAKPVLDAWVERETGGLLTEVPAEPLIETRVTLLNAAVFGARWASPFDPELTTVLDFTRADGSTVRASYMNQLVFTRFASGAGWQAVDLSYTDGYVMRLVLPDEPGAVPADVWRDVADRFAPGEPLFVELALPRWDAETTVDLMEHLDPFGLAVLADPGGDLDGIFTGAEVGTLAQAAVVSVAEAGTVAAAVTQVGVVETSAPVADVALRFDRPFDYQIVERETGLVLFAGHVADPTVG